MELKANVLLRKVGSDYFIVEPNQGMTDFARVVVLNEVAAFLFEQLKGQVFERPRVIQLLVDNFEVLVAKAEDDATVFLEKLAKNGLLIDNEK